jgi:hypothetical protein
MAAAVAGTSMMAAAVPFGAGLPVLPNQTLPTPVMPGIAAKMPSAQGAVVNVDVEIRGFGEDFDDAEKSATEAELPGWTVHATDHETRDGFQAWLAANREKLKALDATAGDKKAQAARHKASHGPLIIVGGRYLGRNGVDALDEVILEAKRAALRNHGSPQDDSKVTMESGPSGCAGGCCDGGLRPPLQSAWWKAFKAVAVVFLVSLFVYGFVQASMIKARARKSAAMQEHLAAENEVEVTAELQRRLENFYRRVNPAKLEEDVFFVEDTLRRWSGRKGGVESLLEKLERKYCGGDRCLRNEL